MVDIGGSWQKIITGQALKWSLQGKRKRVPLKNTWRRHMESERIERHMAQARNGNL